MTAEQQKQLDQLVWIDPERLSGEPCFKGTRVPVQALIDHIEGNSTLEDFLKGFPSVSRQQAIQFALLSFAFKATKLIPTDQYSVLYRKQ